MVFWGGDWRLLTATVIIVLLLNIGTSMAVPAAPAVHTRSQPDGSVFQVVQKGDERGAWLETPGGYTVTEKNGKWYYATRQGSQLAPTAFEVGKANPALVGLQKHLKPSFPQVAPVPGASLPPAGFSYVPAAPSSQYSSSPGGPQLSPSAQYASAPWLGNDGVIVLLVNFTDNPAVNPALYSPGWYQNLLFNQSNGSSMANYYNETSYDQYNLSGTVGSGWTDSQHSMSFYGGDNDLWAILQGCGSIDNCSYRLICEALDLADSVIDFSQYDKDNDGYIDHVIVVHAGQDQAATSSPNDIWSVRWSGINSICPNQPWDGKDVYSGSILAEDSPLGTFAHEYGHDLGLPDLYDIDYSSDGIGLWGMMSFGSWLPGISGTSPAHFIGWSRYKLGWINPVDLTSVTDLNNHTIAAIELYNYSSLYQHNISATEYFMIENRQKIGFDSYIPGDGILVWHVDESKSSNANENDRMVDLEEADDNGELDLYGFPQGQTTDPFYNTLTGFSSVTSPNSRSKSGVPSGFSMTILSANWTNMTANLNDANPPDIVLTSPTPANMSFEIVNYAFVNSSLDENATDAFLEWDNSTDRVNYTMSGSGMNWSLNMTSLNDGVYRYAVWVNDSANNWNVSEAREVYIAVNLLIVVNSPTNATYDVNWTDFNATLSRPTDMVLLSVNGSANTTLQNNTATFFFNVTYGNLTDGQHNVTFWANDSTDVAETTVWLTIDTTAPDISFVPPTPANSTLSAQNYVVVNVSFSKPPASAILEWDGTNESMSGSGIIWHVNKTGLQRGNYTYMVYANDSQGRMNVSEGRLVEVPLTCPVTITSDETLLVDMVHTSGAACITLGADSITLDCNGHTITGSGSGYGVYAFQKNGVKVQNCTISTFSSGVYYHETNNSHVINVTANSTDTGGVFMNHSWDNVVRNSSLVFNNVGSLGSGIYMLYGGRNNISSCNTSYNDFGVALTYSGSNIVSGVISSYNTEDGLDLYNASGNQVSGCEMEHHTAGSNKMGIKMWSYSISNTIWNNTITGNLADGVSIASGCTGNVFYHNTFLGNFLDVNSAATGNEFNTTANGVPQGNYWMGEILALAIYDNDGDGFGDSGPQYPYSAANGATMVSSNVVDWGPGGANIPPDLVMVSPLNTTYGPEVYFNVTISEAADWCGYSLDGQANVSMANDTSARTLFWAVNSTMTSGQHSVMFHCNDTIGYMNTTGPLYFTSDSTPPSIAFVPPTPSNLSVVTVDYIYVNVTTTEAADSVIMGWNGVNETLGGSGTSWYVNKTSLTNMNHSFLVYANDTYGNLNSSGIITVTVSAPPSITLESPLNQSYSNGTIAFNITVNTPLDTALFSINDTVNSTMGNDTLYHYFNVTYPEIGTGQHNVTFWVNDSTGASNQNTVWFMVDATPPYFHSYKRLPYLPNEDQMVQVNVTVEDSMSSISTVILEWNGTANYTVPSCSGTEYCFIIGPGNLTPHDNTTYVWYANDSAGNMNMSDQLEFIVDNQLPVPIGVMIISNDTNNRTGGNLTGLWAFSDSDTGDIEADNWTKWYMNDTEQPSLENMTVVLPGNTSKDDVWVFSVSVNDSYNWSSWVNSSGFTILNTPPAAPTLSAPANDTNVSTTNVTFSFSATDEDSDALSYSIYIGGAFNLSAQSTSAEVNFTDGYYSWHVIANDSQYNSSQSATWHFRVDMTGPSVSSATVSPTPVLEGENTSIFASVSDALTGVSSVWYNMSNSTWSSSDVMPLQSGSTYNRSVNTSGMTEGIYNVTVYANDSLGNTMSAYAGTLEISEISTINISIMDEGGNLTNATKVTLLYSGTSIPFNQSSDNVSGFWTSAAGGIWDLLIENPSFNITFQGVNTSGNISSNVTMDANLTGLANPSGVLTILNAMAASAGFSFTGVQIVIPFNTSLFTSTSRATVYKCPTWNFTSGSCPGGWVNVTGNSTINLTTNITTVNDASLSAFIVAESFWCGDGIVDSGEQCDDGNAASGDGCSSSCQTEVPAQPPSGGGGTSTGGGGAYVPPPENVTDSVTGVCVSGSRRCLGDTLQRCQAGGGAWDVLETCQYGCDPTALSCRPGPSAICTPGDKRCMGLSVQQCSAAGNAWETVEECGRFCENGICLEEAPPATDILPWVAGLALVIVIIGAAVFIRKKMPKPARKRVPVTPVVMHVPPLKEKAEIPVPAPLPPPPAPPKPKPEHVYPAVHATIRDIQLNPMKYVEKPVRISGKLSFSHRQNLMDARRWHMFEDETGRMPAADHNVFSGKGELIAVVEETKTHQVYLRIVEFRKH